MSTMSISPIAIDLGARFTGVYLAHYHDGHDTLNLNPAAYTVIVPVDGDKITWSQVQRRQRRHQQRCYKRRKLAKRLLELLISEITGQHPKPEILDALHGLLNRRGYNRMETEIDWTSLEEAGPDWHADRFPELFNNEEPLSEQFSRILQNVSLMRKIQSEYSDFWMKKGDLNKDIRKFFGEDDQTIADAHQAMKEAIEKALQSIDMGARHRREYLQNIKKELGKDSRFAFFTKGALDAESLFRLIGNLSNLQLRALRWYFNDKSMADGDYYDDLRLKKTIHRWINRWRPESEDERKRRKELLKSIGKCSSTLDWLMNTSPELTIPPYEDMHNRRPPKDRTLWLNPHALNMLYGDKWRYWAERLGKAPENMAWREGIDEILDLCDRKSRVHTQQFPREDYAATYFLQRLLDRARPFDPYMLRKQAREEVSPAVENGRELLAKDLGRHHVTEFLEFCARYFQETEAARKGLWTPGLLERSDINPPRKKRIMHQLVGQILGLSGMTQEELQDLRENVWIARIGRSSVRAMAKSVEQTRKKYGNFFGVLAERVRAKEAKGEKIGGKDSEKEIQSALLKAEAAANAIANYLGQGDAEKGRYDNPFSIAQLYTILETERHGFSRCSLAAHKENSWRMQMVETEDGKESARCSRLTVDVARPFDGVLRRIIERQAKEIARLKIDHLKEKATSKKHVLVPIIIEENRFAFTQDLHMLKGRKKKAEQMKKILEGQSRLWEAKAERIKKAAKGICAYTGQPLLDSRGELDHILPRSFSFSEHGTVFNSEANLIWVSAQGNRAKKDRRYHLKDLSNTYLAKQFGTSDRETISRQISMVVEKLPKDVPFEALSQKQQKALRHALFMDEREPAFQAAFKRLATHMKSRVNGTQAWLAKNIIKEMKNKLQQEGFENIDFEIIKVPSERVRQMRDLMGHSNPRLRKSEQQGAASHVLDAMCAFAAAAEQSDALRLPEWVSEDMDFLMESFPPWVNINWLERTKPYAPHKAPWSFPIFKTGLYAENFLNIWWSDRGLRIGFDMKNSNEVLGNKTERLIQILAPFMKKQPPSAPPKGQPVCLKIDKIRALSLLQRAARMPLDHESLQAAVLLNHLRYVTQKKEIKAHLLDSNKKLKKEKDITKEKDFIIKVDFRFPQGSKGKKIDFLCQKGTVELPSKKSWLSLYHLLKQKTDDKNKVKADWKEIGEKLFRPGSKRPHKKARREFSLPILATMQGAYRVKRRAPRGELFQMLMIGGYANCGFAVRSGEIDWKKTVPIKILKKSPRVSPAGKLNPADGNRSFVPLDKWLEIKDHGIPGIISLWACPGTKDRMYVKIRQGADTFFEWLEMIPDIPITEVPAEIKPHSKKALKSRLGFVGYPRSNLFMTRIGNEMEYWFIVEFTSSELKDAYKQAWLEKKAG